MGYGGLHKWQREGNSHKQQKKEQSHEGANNYFFKFFDTAICFKFVQYTAQV